MSLSPRLVIPHALRRSQSLPDHVVVTAACICGRLVLPYRYPELILPLACDDPECRQLHRMFTSATN